MTSDERLLEFSQMFEVALNALDNIYKLHWQIN